MMDRRKSATSHDQNNELTTATNRPLLSDPPRRDNDYRARRKAGLETDP